MADLPSEFWGGWIAVLTLTTLAGLAALVASVYFGRPDPKEVEGLTWDETLQEGATPAPLWWFWLTLALLVVSLVYLIFYPGLGRFAGVLHWSQHHEIATSARHFEERFGERRAAVARADVAALKADGAAMRSAASVFANHCAACHGADARGQARLFPDLRDAEWQWGGTAAAVEQTITLGRQAVMPPWQAVLGEEGVAEVADYVLALAEGRGEADEVAAGRARYGQICSACHGPDGAGNPLLGAPPLNDAAWLYGSSREDVMASIALGRNGQMPAFGGRLDATQIRLLTAYLAE
ncbi:MAG TPA: cytochrome-c oxidase, cbb3-type subunit III [Gammaproteobacteria bacterium]